MTTPAPRWRPRTEPAALFLLVFAAVPAAGGGERPLLAFVKAADIRAALRRALDELAAAGWREPDLQGAKPLPADPAAEPDPLAREAIERAVRCGFGYLAYG
jgi:hypothetical protein